MYILGISCFYHDSSVCLVKDGKVIVAIEEERLTRKKHDNSFPKKSIEFCLEYANISINEVDQVCFYERPDLKFHRFLLQHLRNAPLSFELFKNSFPHWLKTKINIEVVLRKETGFHGKIDFIDHHTAHAASAFYPSPFDEAVILTIDGVGEWATTTYGFGSGNKIELVKEITFPDSIGLLYSAITAFLGFSVNNSEYKVMGLSAYGNTDKSTNRYYKLLKETVITKPDGSYQLDMRYFSFDYKGMMFSRSLEKLLGLSPVSARNPLNKDHYDLAAALQILTEELVIAIIDFIHSQYNCSNLVLAGGVALNSLLNGKILSKTKFKDIFIQPASGDGGTSLGAALYCYHMLNNHGNRDKHQSAYLGPEFDNNFIRSFLDSHYVKYHYFEDINELISETSALIFKNNVIGWFQGRMEWGPRALGARSILSNPCNKDMQSLLNEKVKHREKFRPFAPVVCIDDAKKYFETDDPIPLPTDYMLMVYPIKQEYREILPAVTHVDGTGRLQTIRKDQNPNYYSLIKEFGKLSGIPILINTSFNIRGEPIVCTPKDAYRCMMGTGIDYLVMGNFLIKREDNPQDIWDSEKLAVD